MAAGLLTATSQAMSKREETGRLKPLPNTPSIILLFGLDGTLGEAEAGIKIAQNEPRLPNSHATHRYVDQSLHYPELMQRLIYEEVPRSHSLTCQFTANRSSCMQKEHVFEGPKRH